MLDNLFLFISENMFIVTMAFIFGLNTFFATLTPLSIDDSRPLSAKNNYTMIEGQNIAPYIIYLVAIFWACVIISVFYDKGVDLTILAR